MPTLDKANLARAVSNMFDASGKVRTEFAEEELLRLTNLSWASHGEGEAYSWWKPIGSIAGIEHCRNLDEIDLNGNHIRDVGPLAALTKLRTLGLTDTEVSDLTPLAGLRELESLFLYGSKVRSVAPLAGLPKLAKLSMSDNPCDDIEALRALPALQELSYTRREPLPDAAIAVFVALHDRGVKLLVSADSQARINAILAARLGPDVVAERLKALGLDDVASRWALLRAAADDQGTALHTLVRRLRSTPDEVAAEGIRVLAAAGVSADTPGKYGGNALYALLDANGGDAAFAAMVAASRELNPPHPPFGHWNAWMGQPELPRAPYVALAKAVAERPHRVDALLAAGASRAHPAAVIAACAKGDVAYVAAALDAGADPDGYWDGRTPLFAALGSDHVDVVRLLLARGADANRWVWQPISSRPVHAARSPEALQLLLDAGADLRARDSHGRTALHLLAEKIRWYADPDKVRALAKPLIAALPAHDPTGLGTVLTNFADGRPDVNEVRQAAFHDVFMAVWDAGADPLLPKWVEREYLPTQTKRKLLRQTVDKHDKWPAAVLAVLGDVATVEVGTRAFRALGTALDEELEVPGAEDRVAALLAGDPVGAAIAALPRSPLWAKVAWAHLNGGKTPEGHSLWRLVRHEPALRAALLDAGCPTTYVEPRGASTHHLFAETATLDELLRLGPPAPDALPCTPLAYAVATRAAKDAAFRTWFERFEVDFTGPAGAAAKALLV